jgi:hypothetical protein
MHFSQWIYRKTDVQRSGHDAQIMALLAGRNDFRAKPIGTQSQSFRVYISEAIAKGAQVLLDTL